MERFNCAIGDAYVTVRFSKVFYNEEFHGWELEDMEVFHNKKKIKVTSKVEDDLQEQVINQLKEESHYGVCIHD